MESQSGLIAAYRLDGEGGGEALDFDGVRGWEPGGRTLWVHLDYACEDARQWLDTESGIDPVICEALTAEDARPRCVAGKGGLLVILRGVNLNPGADPEDMVSIRIWLETDRIVTVRHRRVMAVDDLREALSDGTGPGSSGAFLVQLADLLVMRMGNVVGELDDTADDLEGQVLTHESYELRPRIADMRRMAISVRRHLAPQRDVMTRLQSEPVPWLTELDRGRIREIADRTLRHVEDLDAIRDRAAVTQEELNSRLTEQMNRTMYVLSIVAGIFLPLGLLTGLLGINVGGIPGTDNPIAFALVCVLLLVIALGQIWLFKRKHWM